MLEFAPDVLPAAGTGRAARFPGPAPAFFAGLHGGGEGLAVLAG